MSFESGYAASGDSSSVIIDLLPDFISQPVGDIVERVSEIVSAWESLGFENSNWEVRINPYDPLSGISTVKIRLNF